MRTVTKNTIEEIEIEKIGKIDVECIDLTLSDEEESSTSDTDASNTTNDILVNIAGNILTRRHLKILQSPSAWFTDDLINAFFHKLTAQKREFETFAVSSFFYDALVKRGGEYCSRHWLSKDLRSFLHKTDAEFILFPINSSASHWTLVLWRLKLGILEYYDSMMCKRSGNRIMKKLSEFFNEYDISADSSGESESVDNKSNESAEDKKDTVDIKDTVDTQDTVDTDTKTENTETITQAFLNLSLSNSTSTIPRITTLLIPKGQVQQTDGSSCGPFCCWNGKRLLDNASDTVDTVDIYKFRASLVDFFLNEEE